MSKDPQKQTSFPLGQDALKGPKPADQLHGLQTLAARLHPQKSDFKLQDHYSFQDLLDLMAFLRSPEGCPWDRVQSHDSIKGSMIEEAWEAVDAIESGKPDRLQDELGDVLLQVVFHAQIAQDQEEFNIDQVIAGLCRKLIRRHSHIFGQDHAEDPDTVLKTWAENKKVEKGLKTETDVLRDVPRHIPALSRAYKLQKKAAACGFDWPEISGAAAKIQEESEELMAVYEDPDTCPETAKQRLAEEGGDLLFAVVNVLRFMKIDPEIALNQANDKFIRRFAGMEDKAGAQGHMLADLSLEEMDELWKQVKAEEAGPCA